MSDRDYLNVLSSLKCDRCGRMTTHLRTRNMQMLCMHCIDELDNPYRRGMKTALIAFAILYILLFGCRCSINVDSRPTDTPNTNPPALQRYEVQNG